MNLFSQFFGPAINQIDPTGVKTRISSKPAPFLLDVRQPEEYREGHIFGTRLIPLSQLSQRLDELPRDREIVCICRSGNRSGAAARQLAAAGFKVYNLKGGMIAWSKAGYPVKKGKT